MELDLEEQRKTCKERTVKYARYEDVDNETFEPHCRTAEYNSLLQNK